MLLFFSPTDIPWPEEEESLSSDAQDAINALLTLDPAARPGARGNHHFTTWFIHKDGVLLIMYM